MKIINLFLLLILVVTTIQAAIVGNIEIDSSVTNTGTAKLSIPVKLPDGINGHTPELSIEYDSSGANDILGMGFSIGGLSSIRRNKANLAQDGPMIGKVRSITLGNDDQLTLDGQRLKK